MYQNEINIHKQNAHELEIKDGESLDNALNMLVNLHNRGEYEWYINYSGYKFYSADIDYIKAYKAQRDSFIIKAQLEEIISKGSQYISIYKKEAWKSLVTEVLGPDKEWINTLNIVIKYLNLLNQDITVDEIASMYVKEFNNIIDNWYASSILNIIATYSDRGPEFDLAVIKKIKEESKQKISSHTKYAKRLKDVNTLNDLNVPFEEAQQLVNSDIYKLSLGLFHAQVIEIDRNTYLGIDEDGKLILSQLIDDRLVTFIIDKSETIRIITDMKTNKSFITSDKYLQTNIEEIEVSLVKLRRNLNTLAYIHKKVTQLLTNNNSIIAKETNAQRELQELKSNVSSKSPIKTIDAIINIEENKQRKLNK